MERWERTWLILQLLYPKIRSCSITIKPSHYLVFVSLVPLYLDSKETLCEVVYQIIIIKEIYVPLLVLEKTPENNVDSQENRQMFDNPAQHMNPDSHLMHK